MATPGPHPAITADGLPSQLPDIDPDETGDWLDSLDGLLEDKGRNRARFIMLKLLERARARQVGLPALRSSDYINTIPPESEPWFPGDEHIERRIRAFIRWNAAIMVSKANRKGLEVGGHIATYQSAASLYEVGFNHFFRGKDHPGGGDHVFIQGHASPGIYARAYLEGRLTTDQLDAFRQEVSHGPGKGLSSYPHPRLMPHFWEFPTVSMGIGAINSVVQVTVEPRLVDRVDCANAHGDCRELPEVRHQPGVWVGGKSLAGSARDFLPEGVELVGGEPSFEVGPSIDTGRRMALDEDVVTAAGMILASEEMVEADLIQAGGTLVGRDVTADLEALAIGLAHHDRRIPSDECTNPALDVLITREPGLGFRWNRVDVIAAPQRRQAYLPRSGLLKQLEHDEPGSVPSF